VIQLEHGRRATYTNHGCRCQACKSAHNQYWQAWRAGRRLRAFVDAAECASHVRFLREHGFTCRRIAHLAGTSPSTILRLARGDYPRIDARYAGRLLAINLSHRELNLSHRQL
jgi:hypothetical protein